MVFLCQNKIIQEKEEAHMLNENIKTLRKSNGFTQEELANRLNVVRQTVSKWEKGISVPDAEMLQKIAEIFDCDVSRLLGDSIETIESKDSLVEQLSRINEQLVVKNRRNRRIWKIVGIVVAIVIIFQLLFLAMGVVGFTSYQVNTDTYVEEVVDNNTFS